MTKRLQSRRTHPGLDCTAARGLGIKTTLLLLAALLLAPLVRLAAAEPKPNVLLILSDDHSYPHVGCYGNKDIMTPNLDRFAAEGMRFDRADVTSPQWAPSRAQLHRALAGGDRDVAPRIAPAARVQAVSRGVAGGRPAGSPGPRGEWITGTAQT